jgi:2-polyprenyl-3-methyl-5-hydroxy-6-metoxy-1,4-benzoquinol methylase
LLRSLARFVDRALEKIAREMGPWLPFSIRNLVWRHIDKKGKCILDIGCGSGQPVEFINRHRQFYVVGIDLFQPYLRYLKQNEIYDDCILADVCQLPARPKKFDIVFALELVEHLEKEEGLRLINTMEKIARRQVILAVPNGGYRQGAMKTEPNPYQKHKSIWFPAELKQRGYKVRGSGVYKLCDEQSFLVRHPFRPLWYALYVLAGPFVYFFPGASCVMICSKTVKQPGMR